MFIDSVRCVCAREGSKQIVSGSNDKSERVWDISSGKSISIINAHSGKLHFYI